MAAGPLVADRLGRSGYAIAQLLRFAWIETQCCLFAAAIFTGLAVSRMAPLPIARYDALLAYGLTITVLCYLLRLETAREVAVIFAFHLVGLGLELFKVRVGSWSYPEEAWTRVGGVPLYSGFMYAAVGSYLCQAFRRFDLRVNGFPWLPATVLAVAAYANFFTHHWLPDVRWLVAVGLVVVLWRSRVSFAVGGRRYAMPLSLSFVLDRLLPLGRGEWGDLARRLAVPGSGRLLAARARRQLGLVGLAGQPQLRTGRRRQALGGHLLRRTRCPAARHATHLSGHGATARGFKIQILAEWDEGRQLGSTAVSGSG